MKPTKGYRVFTVVNTFIMILVIFFTLYPFLYLVAQSFSSEAAIYSNKVTFYPVDFTTSTYKYILSNSDFFNYYKNTIIYTALGTVIAVASTALLAYPLSKSYQRLRLNKYIMPFVVFTMYFAGGMIPNYILIAQWLGLRDSVWAIVLPGAVGTFNLMVMKSSFAGLPEELEEAASIDGLGTYGIFLRIVLPLSKPILATMVLFYMVGIWNEWFGPFLYLDTKAKWPVSLYIRQLVEGSNSVSAEASSAEASNITANIKSTAMVLTSLPIICVYPFVQKYFVQGMTMGAVKG